MSKKPQCLCQTFEKFGSTDVNTVDDLINAIISTGKKDLHSSFALSYKDFGDCIDYLSLKYLDRDGKIYYLKDRQYTNVLKTVDDVVNALTPIKNKKLTKDDDMIVSVFIEVYRNAGIAFGFSKRSK